MVRKVGRMLVLFTDKERGWGRGWRIVWVRNDEITFRPVTFEVLVGNNIRQFFYVFR